MVVYEPNWTGAKGVLHGPGTRIFLWEAANLFGTEHRWRCAEMGPLLHFTQKGVLRSGAEVLSIAANENMIVVRTLPGCASTVGEFIDVQKHEAILGTVAGDNTLLVIPASQRRTKNVVEFLKNKLIRGME